MKTKLEIFINRLEKINIRLDLFSNYPWIYINKINDKVVKEKYQSEHGFTIAYYPIQKDQEFKFTDLKQIFELIKKYK
jgi:hypothetical protein